jgi:hypothetical protein
MVVELIDRCEANGPELERGEDLQRYAARVRAALAN